MFEVDNFIIIDIIKQGETMKNENTIRNMVKYFNEMYRLAIYDATVPEELGLEVEFSAIDYALDENLETWIKTLNYIDSLNKKIVKIAKENPESYEGCRILNRKLVMIIDGMKKVMEKDMHVTGWMRNKGRIEVIL